MMAGVTSAEGEAGQGVWSLAQYQRVESSLLAKQSQKSKNISIKVSLKASFPSSL